jgi:hypothetical protein
MALSEAMKKELLAAKIDPQKAAEFVQKLVKGLTSAADNKTSEPLSLVVKETNAANRDAAAGICIVSVQAPFGICICILPPGLGC